MVNMILKKTVLPSLAYRLNINSLRQKVIANNIANVNTEGYKAKEVNFDNILSESQKKIDVNTTHVNHFTTAPDYQGRVIDNPDEEIKNGINNVDIDHEMVGLAKNQMEFNFSATMVTRLFRTIRNCINEKVQF